MKSFVAATIAAAATGVLVLGTVPASAAPADPFHNHTRGVVAATAAATPAPFVQTAAPERVYIGSRVTRVALAANLSETRPTFEVALVTDTSDDALVAADRVLQPATPTATLRTTLDIDVANLPGTGNYDWAFVTYANRDFTGASLVYVPTTVKLSSLLGLSATRAGDVLTVRASARQYSVAPNAYRAWANRVVSVQRYTSNGWVTLRNVRTDSNGNLTTGLRIPFQVTLRAVDPDSLQVWGAISATQVR